ncbi:energy transducer TonB [Candidatus Methylopumilus universalis]|uniref:energy transducer TonB n=1 Tax=Candidatus Methylopumilus universalis TaxID=2588536 RepID=UPI0011214377|nr:energy transducer TonB [Candidatus Methylopumilus universalis]QDC99332.1 energy transducer TonB [Candidatus Methylopumilus universalis]
MTKSKLFLVITISSFFLSGCGSQVKEKFINKVIEEQKNSWLNIKTDEQTRQYAKCLFDVYNNLGLVEKIRFYLDTLDIIHIPASDPLFFEIGFKAGFSCSYEALYGKKNDSGNISEQPEQAEEEDLNNVKHYKDEKPIQKIQSKNESIFSKLRKSSEISSNKKESEMQEKKYGSENSSTNSNHDKKNVTTLYEYQTNTGCIYKEIAPSKQNNRSIHWDGSCQNGYMHGFGSLIIDDKLKNTTTVCEANYSYGLENGQGKCTYNHNNNEMIITETGIYKNGKFFSGSREYEDQAGLYKKDILEHPSYPGNQEHSSQSLENYSNLISKKIRKNFLYPKIAQMRGWQGTVIADLEIDSKGSLISVKIKKSSSYEVLDNEALEMIRKASPFPPPPDNLRGKNLNALLPISFKLE